MDPTFDRLCHDLILEYFIHSCYKKTAKAFDSEYKEQYQHAITAPTLDTGIDAMEIDQPDNAETKGVSIDEQAWLLLDARRDLYDAIERGDIPLALELIRKRFPGLIQDDNNKYTDNGSMGGLVGNEKAKVDRVLFKLKCQQFIEIVRSSTEVDAIRYAQQYLRPIDEEYQAMVTEVASLIAYINPGQSHQAHLLSQDRRRQLADEVNGIILAYCKLPEQTAMEKLQKQYQVVQQELQSAKNMDGKSYHHRDKLTI